MLNALKNVWFRDTQEKDLFINEVAVRIKAGFLLAIPIFMSFTLYEAIFVSNWIVDGNTLVDTGDMNFDEHIIYQVEATRRTYDYTFQIWVLFYGLFEMMSGMFVWSSRLSPLNHIATFLARNEKPVWKPLVPKRFAWVMGSSFIVVCLIYFAPDSLARAVNGLWGEPLLSTTENYMSAWIPLILVWVCLLFMWLETVLGYCAGCKIHALMVALGILKEPCESCNNLDWDEIARKNEVRLAAQAKQKIAE